METADQNFVEVYRAAGVPQAHALRMVLEEAGIPVVIANSDLQGAIGEISAGWASAPRLMVERANVDQACELIRRSDVTIDSESNSKLTLSETLGILPFFPFATALAVAEYLAPETKPAETETNSCLACGATMAESETQCANCGWTYACEPDPEADDPAETDDF